MYDIFIQPTKINRALDGDTFIVENQKSRGEHKGQIKVEEKRTIKNKKSKVDIPRQY